VFGRPSRRPQPVTLAYPTLVSKPKTAEADIPRLATSHPQVDDTSAILLWADELLIMSMAATLHAFLYGLPLLIPNAF